MKLNVKTSIGSYDITFSQGGTALASEIFDLDRKVLVVTDSGVPKEYASSVAAAVKEGHVFCFERGEQSKSLDTYRAILLFMAENGFTRSDCVVAVGGGVTGDMAGFAAASYMRGVDFYNIPTTLLSQVDSSIGGKVAVDLNSYKNLVGAFYPPKGVIIDVSLLKTLDKRQLVNGFAEVIKMAACCDESLFCDIESGRFDLNDIIYRALCIKKGVVERDEREKGERRVLNFGHTVGHAIESLGGFEKYLHGEAVSVGMTYMCAPNVKSRLIKALKNAGLPVEREYGADSLYRFIIHDKKTSGGNITVVYLEDIGKYRFIEMPLEKIKAMLV